MRSIKSFIFFVLVLLLAACQSRPDYVVDEDTMIDLLTDVHMAEGLLDMQQRENRDNQEYGQRVIAAVLEKYNISKADYDTSLVWYSQHLSQLIRIYRHVDENLNARQQDWETIVAESGVTAIGASGDSVNLWRHQPYVVMDETRLSHARLWDMKVDTTFHVGDRINWSMYVGVVPQGHEVVASLLLMYDESSSSSVSSSQAQTVSVVKGDTLIALSCEGDPAKNISSVVASIHLLRIDSISAPLMPCVVDGFQLIRLHNKN